MDLGDLGVHFIYFLTELCSGRGKMKGEQDGHFRSIQIPNQRFFIYE